MENVPPALLDPVDEADRAAVRRWWDGLPETDRRQVGDLYDERHEAYLFVPKADDEPPPAVTGGHFLAADDAWLFADWEAGWREHLVEHAPDYLGDCWAPNSVILAVQFRTFCWRGDEPGVRCRVPDWRLTRFEPHKWPPSERYCCRDSRRTWRRTLASKVAIPGDTSSACRPINW